MMTTHDIPVNSASENQQFIATPGIRVWLKELCHLISATMHFK